MEFKINYSLLSKYRTILMGIAMLMVMFFHSTVSVEQSHTLSFIKSIGNSGVDIFLFVSGIGMYFSWTRSTEIKKFLTRRVLRIIPTYLPVVLVYSVYMLFKNQITLRDFFLNITTLNLWFNSSVQYWYISAIIVLYFFTPFYLKCYVKNSNKVTLIALAVSAILIFICNYEPLNYLRIFFSRIPIYILGIRFGELSYEKKRISNVSLAGYCVLLFVGIIGEVIYFKKFEDSIIMYSWQKIFYIFTTISICILLSIMLEFVGKISNYKFKFLYLIGGITLEIYTFHERFLNITDPFKYRLNLDKYYVSYNIIIIVIAIVCAIIWNKVVTFLFYSKLSDDLRKVKSEKEAKSNMKNMNGSCEKQNKYEIEG